MKGKFHAKWLTCLFTIDRIHYIKRFFCVNLSQWTKYGVIILHMGQKDIQNTELEWEDRDGIRQIHFYLLVIALYLYELYE